MAGPYYIDNVNGNDQDIAIAGDGAYTHIGATLVKAGAFANAAVGYLIDLTGGTNITPGLYQIATNADANTVTLTTQPGTGDVADVTVDSNDGLSEAQAFASLCKAADMVAAGEIVYVQAGTDYTTQDSANDCVLFISTIGTTTTPILWQGYLSTINDGGIVTVDADANTLASAAISDAANMGYNVFKNFEFTGASGDGCLPGAADNVLFKNCRFTNNDGDGIDGDNGINFENCLGDNNGAKGFNLDGYPVFIGCVAHTNTTEGIYSTGALGITIFCLAYNNGAFSSIRVGYAINCTTDGENQANSIGVYIDGTKGASVNNILHDLATGIEASADGGELQIARNNLFNSNTADVSNFLAVSAGNGVGNRGDVAAAPGFTGEAGDDYTLTGAGAADAAGLDAKFTVDFWDSFIGATNPPSP